MVYIRLIDAGQRTKTYLAIKNVVLPYQLKVLKTYLVDLHEVKIIIRGANSTLLSRVYGNTEIMLCK